MTPHLNMDSTHGSKIDTSKMDQAGVNFKPKINEIDSRSKSSVEINS